jgi:hypothetical protein
MVAIEMHETEGCHDEPNSIFIAQQNKCFNYPWLSAHYGSLSVSCSENGSEAKLALYAQEDCVGKPDTQVMATKQCIQVLVIASMVTCIKSR